MDKEGLLQELVTSVNNGEISRNEIMERLNFASEVSQKRDGENKKSSHFTITKILYVLGAVIVIVGIGFFVAQIWYDIGSVGRILITLGLGLLIAAIGSVLLKEKPEEKIGPIFHFIGGMLIPGGALVTLFELNVNIDSFWPFAITFGALFAFYLLLNAIHKHPILTFFAIANGTAFVYQLVEAMFDIPHGIRQDLYTYLTMAIGVSYLLLAHSFRVGWNRKLVGILYFFGIGSFLGAAFPDREIFLPSR